MTSDRYESLVLPYARDQARTSVASMSSRHRQPDFFGLGYVEIDFGKPQTIKFDGGSFKLAIDDIYLYSLDAKDPITGHVFDVTSNPPPVAGAVPEPGAPAPIRTRSWSCACAGMS